MIQQWYERSFWRNHAQQLFDYFAKRRGYLVRFSNTEATAYVDMHHKVCVLGVNFPKIQGNVRYKIHHGVRLRERWIEAFTAHEAAHVRFSGVKPAPKTLGWLWNALEDERIERLQAASADDLRAVFTFMGDVYLEKARDGKDVGHCLNGCLLWRWAHDHPKGWIPDDLVTWEQVQPLVETAWNAQTSDEVVKIAIKILEILQLEEDEEDKTPELVYPLSALCGLKLGDVGQEEVEFGQDGISCPASVPDFEIALEEIEGEARAFAQVLKPATKPLFQRSDRSRGRFDYGRHVADCERQYRKKTTPGRPDDISLALAIDVSGSMDGANITACLKTATMILRSCELVGVPVACATFGFRHTVIGDFQTSPETQRAALYSKQLETHTHLAPTLKWALEQRHRALKQYVIVISDGELEDFDYSQCQIYIKDSKAVVVPILLDAEEEARAKYRDAFGRIMEIRHPNELMAQLKSWVLATR
jgi:hypothetical protein